MTADYITITYSDFTGSVKVSVFYFCYAGYLNWLFE